MCVFSTSLPADDNVGGKTVQLYWDSERTMLLYYTDKMLYRHKHERAQTQRSPQPITIKNTEKNYNRLPSQRPNRGDHSERERKGGLTHTHAHTANDGQKRQTGMISEAHTMVALSLWGCTPTADFHPPPTKSTKEYTYARKQTLQRRHRPRLHPLL